MPGASGFGRGFTIALANAEALLQGHAGPVFHPLTQSFSVREHLRVPEPDDIPQPDDVPKRSADSRGLLRRPERRTELAEPSLVDRPVITVELILTNRTAFAVNRCGPRLTRRLHRHEPESRPEQRQPNRDRQP